MKSLLDRKKKVLDSDSVNNNVYKSDEIGDSGETITGVILENAERILDVIDAGINIEIDPIIIHQNKLDELVDEPIYVEELYYAAPELTQLPEEILLKIVRFLNFRDLVNFAKTTHRNNRIARVQLK